MMMLRVRVHSELTLRTHIDFSRKPKEKELLPGRCHQGGLRADSLIDLWAIRLSRMLQVLDRYPDTALLLPMHRNPTVREPLQALLGSHPRVVLTEPLDYDRLVAAMKGCCLLLTAANCCSLLLPTAAC